MSDWKPIETAPQTKGCVFVTSADEYPGIEVLTTPFFMHNGELRGWNQNSNNMSKIKHWKWWAPILPPPSDYTEDS